VRRSSCSCPDSAGFALEITGAGTERSLGTLGDLRWLLAFRGLVDEAFQVLEESDWRTRQLDNWLA
jgi:hypothetical protein